MTKEFNLLFANIWQVLFFIVLAFVGIAVTFSFVDNSPTKGIKPDLIVEWEGSFTKDKLDNARNTSGLQLGSYGISESPKPEAIMAQLYLEEYDQVIRVASTRTSDAPSFIKVQAQKVQNSPEYFHSLTWHNLFFTVGSSGSIEGYGALSSKVFFLALTILVSNLVAVERQYGTFLVTIGTIKGRSGMIKNKFISILLISLTLMTILLLVSLYPVISSGEIKLANVAISDALHQLNIWDTSLIGGFFIILLLWVESVVLFSSQIILLSTLVYSSVESILFGVLGFVVLPSVLNSILPIQLLIFPENLIGLFRIGLNPGDSTDVLGNFLAWRPWLPANNWALLFYVTCLSVILSVFCLYFAQKKQKIWV